MPAAGFFHVDCAVTLQRLHCLFVMDASSRYVHILGITASPDGPCTTQQIRNLLLDPGDRPAGVRFLVRDRAGQLTGSFDAVFTAEGIRILASPPAGTPSQRGPSARESSAPCPASSSTGC